MSSEISQGFENVAKICNSVRRDSSQLSSTLSLLVKQDPEDSGGHEGTGGEEDEKDEDILEHSSSHNEVIL
jgi:hypothetical protein